MLYYASIMRTKPVFANFATCVFVMGLTGLVLRADLPQEGRARQTPVRLSGQRRAGGDFIP